MAQFTVEEMIQEVNAEISYRYNVYRRMVQNGRMTPETRNRKIAIMQQVKDVLKLLERDERQMSLFTPTEGG